MEGKQLKVRGNESMYDYFFPESNFLLKWHLRTWP